MFKECLGVEDWGSKKWIFVEADGGCECNAKLECKGKQSPHLPIGIVLEQEQVSCDSSAKAHCCRHSFNGLRRGI